MRASFLMIPLLAMTAACGADAAADQATSARNDAELPPVDAPTRALSPELPGDDPTFRAAIDVYDARPLEEAIAAEFGLIPATHVGTGYFGQKMFVSYWLPATDEMALVACHHLVGYANEIDFPANEIVVRQKTYRDLTESVDLVTVDATGNCRPV